MSSERRTEIAAPLDGGPHNPFSTLRVAGGDWAAGGGPEASGFADSVEALSPLLAGSYLLDQPNVAGMGVGAWDAGPHEPLVDPERSLRRMVRGGRLARMFEEDDEEAGEEDAADRAADLVEAMQRLDGAARGLSAAAPAAVVAGLDSLKRDLGRRLQLERRHNRWLGEIDPADPDAPSRLRAMAPVTSASPEAPAVDRGRSAYDADAARPVAGDRELPAQETLIERIARGDADAVAGLLRDERRTLDGAMRDRLAGFFGHDFADVLVFAGPMAGALARSIHAEAFTHGKMVFFDPKHFRLDTAQGEALVAHELAHTRQEDDRDVRVKEAEALATEAAYLDWIQPGGAPLAEESPLDPIRPGAAAAADVRDGVLRATAERKGQGSASEGPRAKVAEHEAKVKQVLRRVRELLDSDHDLEGQRVGRIDRFFSGPV